MKGYIGEFEELVLLTIANLSKDAYGVAILNDISKRANRKLSIGALHSTLTRLEEKGYISSYLGEPTNERGGRRKRYFEITDSAKAELSNMKALRDQLWAGSKVNLSVK
ncbi:Transcriptional regulator PadR-like family protein [Ekhidna lutea]|uniref:Transcriptional regulator PadR-like family protein n=1 Tax=Ekhidna lutea TaxID=447679 RepID=A0A239LHC4_EKHLU|nr:helix-turn-helix transcriptional regulator [Ekhidna lutea]SNT29861.1 Transcriptional regulator PadR-like family protein [Ekhidna lutea]